jgi:dolichyl-phosphate-mannose-protein mannosyltransferase
MNQLKALFNSVEYHAKIQARRLLGIRIIHRLGSDLRHAQVCTVTSLPSDKARPELRAPFILLAVSCVLHFAWFSWPLSVVFDEVANGRFALFYLRHEFVFDIHPPLGRLLFWMTAWLANLDPSFSFATIGLPFPDSSYLVLRLLPRLAGTLLPVVIYGLAIELGMTRWTALVVGLLVAIDNALLVISRFALTDVFILVFGFAALWSYLRAERLNSWTWLITAAIAAGCAFSVKWTGLAFLGIIGSLQLVKFLSDNTASSLGKILILCVVPAFVYFGVFAAEFAVSDRTSADAASMPPEFQATLAGNPYAGMPAQNRLGQVGKFMELNSMMLDLAFYLTLETHPSISKWYQWPFMMRSVAFWGEDDEPNKEARIYFLGNPVIWWTSGYAILFLLINLPPKIPAFISHAKPPPAERPELIIILGYLANMLPFIVLPRGMFLYHYLPSFIFALLAIGLLLDRAERKHVIGGILLAVAVCGFIYIAPFSYGLVIAQGTADRMLWIEGWR